MNFRKTQKLLMCLAVGVSTLAPGLVLAEDNDSPVASCLQAWGKHPFGRNPSYKTLATAVKVFGVGRDTADTAPTSSPALVLVNPGVNVMGGTTIQVLNPNGWYCFRTNVNVMGGMTIKAHCKAHLATTAGDVLAAGKDSGEKAITVMGSTQVERVGCE